MELSSSAIRIFWAAALIRSLSVGGGLGRDRQEDAEYGASRFGFEIDQTAVAGDDLGYEGETQARARSRTWWMLTSARIGAASSENASIRSTRRRIRSVSSTISWASGASSALAPVFRSWAAPRMPARGFLISCASMRPSPTTERR